MMPDPHKAVMKLVEEDEEVWEIEYVRGLETRCDDLENLAKTMAEELAKWGWGDMHYGPQPQEPRVVAVLEEYRRVLHIDGSGDAE